MKLAVFTDEISGDLSHALDVMAQYDVRDAEIRAVGDKNISDMSGSEVEAIRDTLDRKSARAVVVASPFFKTDLPGTGTGAYGPLHGGSTVGFEGQTQVLQRCIEAAKRLDAKIIRTFTFWKYGDLTPEIEDRIVDAYALPARMAEDAGLTLAIENEPSCYVGTAAEAANLIARIGSPAVKMAWDPANAIWEGEASFPNGYEAAKEHLAHVHVKDARISESGELEVAPVGIGLVNWPTVVEALRADGYAGHLSIETHYNKEGSREPATRECLTALRRIVRD